MQIRIFKDTSKAGYLIYFCALCAVLWLEIFREDTKILQDLLMANNRIHIDLPVSSGNSSGSDNWFYRDIKDIQRLPKAFSEVEEH